MERHLGFERALEHGFRRGVEVRSFGAAEIERARSDARE